MLNCTGIGRMVRAAQMDREMAPRCARRQLKVGTIYTGMFVPFSAFRNGLSGALVTPIQSIVPGMDVLIITCRAFIVVVIGGMGSFWVPSGAR